METVENKYITVAYKLYSIENGEKDFEEEAPVEHPFQFISGLGMTLEPFEAQIKDLQIGDKFDFTIPASEAYGEYDDDHVIDLPKEIFMIEGEFDSDRVVEGAVIPLMTSEGQRINGSVVEVKEDVVVMDMNHPLAGCDLNFTGDIFVLVMELNKITFGKANKLVHEYLGLNYSFKTNKKEANVPDVLDVFKKIRRISCVVNKDVEIYDDNILKEYTPLPYISWIREGIMPFACKKFNIGYSYDKKRIIIPWRYWCGSDNQYVGIVGRTTVSNYQDFDIPKYFGIKPFAKGMDVYGLYENYKTIQEKGYVVLFESEKSTLKRYSRKDGTGVSIGSHTLSDEQVKILISLNVDIVIALDKDVSQNEVRKECEKFYGIRNIYYIYDKWDILGEKESPADRPNKQYEFMLKYKIKYDENEHKELIKWVEEKQKKNI